MPFTKEQQKIGLGALLAVLALLILYRVASFEKPKTAQLVYDRGAVAASPVRHGLATSRTGGADPLSVFFERREERFPGVGRDIFRMENPAPPKTAVRTMVTPTIPPVPQKTPEQIAEEKALAAQEQARADARADLSKFRFLGYVNNTLFLSKDGESFLLKSGDKVLKSYRVKSASKDSVVLEDTVTHVEVKVELSGSEPPPKGK